MFSFRSGVIAKRSLDSSSLLKFPIANKPEERLPVSPVWSFRRRYHDNNQSDGALLAASCHTATASQKRQTPSRQRPSRQDAVTAIIGETKHV